MTGKPLVSIRLYMYSVLKLVHRAYIHPYMLYYTCLHGTIMLCVYVYICFSVLPRPFQQCDSLCLAH